MSLVGTQIQNERGGFMVKVTQKGDFSKVTSYLKRIGHIKYLNILERYGVDGVEALSMATPIDSGDTANSWYYEVGQSKNGYTITFHNHNIKDNVNIAIILDTGHGTGTGGYVVGRHYINPAVLPVFDKIAAEAWKEVTRA